MPPAEFKKEIASRVRAAVPEDTPLLIEFCKKVAFESEGSRLQNETLTQGVGQLFKNPADGQYWMMEDSASGQILGCCFITTEWSDWNSAHYWWLQSVYILPEYRGQGLLQTLITHLEIEAKQAGAYELRLYVHGENGRAIQAYLKTGFEVAPYKIMTKPLR